MILRTVCRAPRCDTETATSAVCVCVCAFAHVCCACRAVMAWLPGVASVNICLRCSLLVLGPLSLSLPATFFLTIPFVLSASASLPLIVATIDDSISGCVSINGLVCSQTPNTTTRTHMHSRPTTLNRCSEHRPRPLAADERIVAARDGRRGRYAGTYIVCRTRCIVHSSQCQTRRCGGGPFPPVA